MGSRGQEPLPLRSSWLERNSLAHASAHPSEDLRRTSQGVQFFPLRRHVHRSTRWRVPAARTFRERRGATQPMMALMAQSSSTRKIANRSRRYRMEPYRRSAGTGGLSHHRHGKEQVRRVKRRQPRSCEACDNGSWKDRREYVWVSAHLRGRTPVDRSDAVRRDAAHRTAC
jgi:hypothetical protein